MGGVAVFMERLPEPVALPTPLPYRQERDFKESSTDNAASPLPPAVVTPAEDMADRNRVADATTAHSYARLAMRSPKIGTGHGQREDSYVSQTNF